MSPYRRLRSGLHRLVGFPLLRPPGRPSRPTAPSESEILFELAKENPGNRLFGRFDASEMLDRMAAAGILSGLARRGYPTPLLRLECRDPSDQRVLLFADSPSRDRLLLEARLVSRRFQPRRALGSLSAEQSFRMIVIHWLVLSDPDRPFSIDRPRLPGQEKPGLGLLSPCIALLGDLARELAQEGVLDVPRYFHTALFYAPAFRFLDPEGEGRFLAIARDLSGVPLALLSEAIAEGCLVDARTGRPEGWEASEQILPVRDPLLRHVRSAWYRKRRDEACARFRFLVDWDRYRLAIASRARAGKYP